MQASAVAYKALDNSVADKSKNLKNTISKKHFEKLANDPYKLKPGRLKQFLTSKYGQSIAEKLLSIIDFNGPVDFITFCHQIEMIIRDRILLL